MGTITSALVPRPENKGPRFLYVLATIVGMVIAIIWLVWIRKILDEETNLPESTTEKLEELSKISWAFLIWTSLLFLLWVYDALFNKSEPGSESIGPGSGSGSVASFLSESEQQQQH